VLIKPLDRALADGDHVYAVIRGTHVNHGGKSGGMTVPSPAAQAELISRGLAKANVSADSISYIEAHGTGTALGDPIEIAGLQRALGADGRAPARCPIGSVKSNIGHLEAAAGIAAVTKVILQLQHRTLVPSLHATELNKSIDFAATPFVVQQITEPWPRPTLPSGEVPLRASISSFGAGGVNVHVILEESPEPTRSGAAVVEPQLVVLSAKKEAQLQAHAQQLLSFIARPANGTEAARLSDLAHTLATGREPFRHRLALLVSNFAELGAALQGYLDAQALPGIFVGDAKLGSGRAQTGALRRGVARALATQLEQQAVSWVLGSVDQVPANEARVRARRVPLPTYPFERKRYWICEERGGARPAIAASGPPSAFEPEPGSAVLRLRGSTERRLVKLLASEINLAEAEIEADEPFESYGVDSVVAARLLSRMEQAYGQLPVALLLERRSIREVVGYLVEHCRERLTHHDSESIRDDGLTNRLAVANM
jgi:acyl transferase domain-containing protein